MFPHLHLFHCVRFFCFDYIYQPFLLSLLVFSHSHVFTKWNHALISYKRPLPPGSLEKLWGAAGVVRVFWNQIRHKDYTDSRLNLHHRLLGFLTIISPYSWDVGLMVDRGPEAQERPPAVGCHQGNVSILNTGLPH